MTMWKTQKLELLCSAASALALSLMMFKAWWCPLLGIISEIPWVFLVIRRRQWGLAPGIILFSLAYLIILIGWLT